MDKRTLRTWVPIIPAGSTTRLGLGTAFTYGLGAGILGVAVMTLGEKLEQLITNRPNSYVPGLTLARLLNLTPNSSNMLYLNHAMHWSQGILGGGIRAIMAYNGVAGPFASFLFTGVRLAIDQTLENVTGVGALPWTWPANEQGIL
ncbi:hypothetical protein HDV00_003102 [Rhizophlyctis rosea]|nr:hypothetical protein HDV00_003102 [Rhizophlyctis rosea]